MDTAGSFGGRNPGKSSKTFFPPFSEIAIDRQGHNATCNFVGFLTFPAKEYPVS